MASDTDSFHRNTFINCPFDGEYRPLLQALLFVLLDCGLEPRIALEQADSGQVRIEKLLSLIKASRFSIHDISRIDPLAPGDLPRFNMAFELGLDLGCRSSVPAKMPKKQCLILEQERYRFQQVLSDLSGNDVRAHGGDPRRLMGEVRNWIKVATGKRLQGATRYWERFNKFLGYLRVVLCDQLGFSEEEIEEIEVAEFIDYARDWIRSQRTA